MKRRFIFFGSRRWPVAYRDFVVNAVLSLPDDAIVVHGACKHGADAIANEAARLRGLEIEAHPAIWLPDRNGPVDYAAGPRRNAHMARLGAERAFGFRMPGKSDGTDNMWSECQLHNIPVTQYGWEWPTRW